MLGIKRKVKYQTNYASTMWEASWLIEETEWPRFNSYFCHIMAVWSWISHFTSSVPEAVSSIKLQVADETPHAELREFIPKLEFSYTNQITIHQVLFPIAPPNNKNKSLENSNVDYWRRNTVSMRHCFFPHEVYKWTNRRSNNA